MYFLRAVVVAIALQLPSVSLVPQLICLLYVSPVAFESLY